MKKRIIILKEDTIERSNHGTITGVIYFDFGDYQFPESEWSDFVVVIVGWWIEAIRRLAKGLTKTEDLKFMEGSLRVRLTSRSNKSCIIECIDNGRASVIEYSKIVSIDELFYNVMSAGNFVLALCETNNWSSTDVYLLKKLLKV